MNRANLLPWLGFLCLSVLIACGQSGTSAPAPAPAPEPPPVTPAPEPEPSPRPPAPEPTDAPAPEETPVPAPERPEPAEGIEREQISANGSVFDALVAGPEDGTVVILLHGFPQTSAEFTAQILALSEEGYRVIAPDQRGYSPGARPPEQAAYNIVNLMNDVLAMADTVGAEKFHLVGHDWGAAVAWLTGILSPDRLITLNPISVPHLDAFAVTRSDPESCQYEASDYMNFFVEPDSHDVMLANDAAILRGTWVGLPEEHVEDYLAVLLQPDALKHGLDWYRANNLSNGGGGGGAIGNVTVPTMYVWSTEDGALCEDGAYLTGDYVDGPYRFEIIEGANHWVPEEAPEILSELLIDHLAKYPESP